MVLLATSYLGEKILKQEMVRIDDELFSHADKLEAGLRFLCQQIDCSFPLWLSKNTREWSKYRQTVFFAEQFLDKVGFDSLHLEWVE